MRTTYDVEKVVRQKSRLLKATRDAQQQRLWAGTEAGAIRFGGVAAVVRATGLAISTVRRVETRKAGAKPDVVRGGAARRHRPRLRSPSANALTGANLADVSLGIALTLHTDRSGDAVPLAMTELSLGDLDLSGPSASVSLLGQF